MGAEELWGWRGEDFWCGLFWYILIACGCQRSIVQDSYYFVSFTDTRISIDYQSTLLNRFCVNLQLRHISFWNWGFFFSKSEFRLELSTK